MMDNPFPLLLLGTGLMLIPFIVVSLTAFVKIAVVLFLLRSALGIQQTPPNLVLYGVTIVLTSYVMSPVVATSWAAVMAETGGANILADPSRWLSLFEVGAGPVKDFLTRFSSETDRAFFLQAAQEMHTDTGFTPRADDLFILAPAFVTAELAKAFEIGVMLYLPFIVIDLVITNILTAMGMMMVSPMVISVPFKLLLFVVVDGWTRLSHGLVIGYVGGG